MVPVRFTLKKYLNFLILLPTAVFVAILYMIYLNQLQRFNLQEEQQRLKYLGKLLQGKYLPHLTQKDLVALQSLIMTDSKAEKIDIVLADVQGKVIASSIGHEFLNSDILDRVEVTEALKDRRHYSQETIGEGLTYLNSAFLVKSGQKTLGILRISSPLNKSFNRFKKDLYTFGGLLVVLLILLALLIYFANRNIRRALSYMRSTISAYVHGDFQAYIVESSNISIEFSMLERSITKLGRSLRGETLRSEKSRIEKDSILATMKEGIVTVDSQGHITHINRAAKKLFNIPRSTIIDDTPLIEVIRYPQVMEIIKEVDFSTPYIKRLLKIIKGDVPQFIQVRASFLHSETGANLGHLLVLNNVTELTMLEENRKEFIANVSHELKTPLTTINGYLETLIDGALDDKSVNRKFLETIYKHSQRLAGIINDLMRLSKLDRSTKDDAGFSMKPTPLCPAIKKVIDSLQDQLETKSMDVRFNTNDQDILVPMQESLLSQAFHNLLENGIKYSDKGSTIDVSCTVEADHVTISFQDHGPGIDETHLKKIFKRFYRIDEARSRREGGAGLGLALVKHIILVHNGAVDVTSELGKGTCFKVTLPLE